MDIRFDGKIAVVTGGASGIGMATAAALRDCGARVIILDRNEGALSMTVAGLVIEGWALDVTDADAVDGRFAAIERDIGPIDVLVASAGVLQRPLPPELLPLKEWRRVVDASLTGTYLTAVAAGTRMAGRGRGAIVTVASIAGLASTPLHGYGPAKAGVIALTQNLAAEWGRSGVRVNAVAPGFTKTPALDRATLFAYLDEGQLAASSALGRLVSAEEVAAAILFLASPLSSAITGIALPVDGGHLATGSWAAYGGLRPARDGGDGGAPL